MNFREENRELARPEVSPEHVDLPQPADDEGQGVGTEGGEVSAGQVEGFQFENTEVPGYEVKYEDQVLIVSGTNLLQINSSNYFDPVTGQHPLVIIRLRSQYRPSPKLGFLNG